MKCDKFQTITQLIGFNTIIIWMQIGVLRPDVRAAFIFSVDYLFFNIY